MRVDLATLDRILTETGELAIAMARARAALERTSASPESETALVEAERIFSTLRDQVMRLRLVPIEPMFRQQRRAVRDLAAAHGKLARLVVESHDVEVDTAVVDQLRDPITHMVRNAIDHALETPDARRAAGKDPVGTITLRAEHRGGHVLVEVRDDGAGFNRDRIVAKARGLGLVGDTESLADEEVWKLVLAPGFSTAEGVSDLSGRGVGMDVVARNVVSLKGSIGIRSEPGKGATVGIRVPLTLAIIPGFGVEAGGETFVIPMEAVRECVHLTEADVRSQGVVRLRDEPLPYVRLGHVLGLDAGSERGDAVVVVESETSRAGVVVDKLLGEVQAVAKPLGDLLCGTGGITSTTILADGRVALIVDVAAVLQAAVQGGSS
jgi:two-component system chemotaxis sensor kinase CheA